MAGSAGAEASPMESAAPEPSAVKMRTTLSFTGDARGHLCRRRRHRARANRTQQSHMPMICEDEAMTTNLGTIELTFCGHAAFAIKTPGGKHIIVDPFLTDNPACPE